MRCNTKTFTLIIDTTVPVDPQVAHAVAAWVTGVPAPLSSARNPHNTVLVEVWCGHHLVPWDEKGQTARPVPSNDAKCRGIGIQFRVKPPVRVLRGIKTQANFCPHLRGHVNSFRLVTVTEELV